MNIIKMKHALYWNIEFIHKNHWLGLTIVMFYKISWVVLHMRVIMFYQGKWYALMNSKSLIALYEIF